TAQLNVQLAGAMAKRYHLGSRLATIEIGGKFRNAHKFDKGYSISYAPNNPIMLSQFPNAFTGNNYYGGTYKLGYNPYYQTVRDYLNGNQSSFTPTSTFGLDPADYGLVEKVGA